MLRRFWGEIELDDPIERHVTRWELPEAEFDTEAMTVRRSLSHMPGLQMGMADDERYASDAACWISLEDW